MAWNRAPCYATQQIVFKHNVRLVGWPSDIPWDNPMGMSSCPKLHRLLDGLEGGQIYFEQLTEAEVDAAAALQPNTEASTHTQGAQEQFSGFYVDTNPAILDTSSSVMVDRMSGVLGDEDD